MKYASSRVERYPASGAFAILSHLVVEPAIEKARRLPVVGRGIAHVLFAFRSHRTSDSFKGSAEYWRHRYASGGDSGRGSYGRNARFKARVLNELVSERAVRSVIEFGCGDGNQLALARYPRYLGLDVSELAVAGCTARFADDPTKAFKLVSEYGGERADMVLSLDVVFHLVEDQAFEAHMRMVFGAADRLVVFFSTNIEIRRAIDRAHVRHRRFTDWVDANATEWRLERHIRNPRARGAKSRRAEFYIYSPA